MHVTVGQPHATPATRATAIQRASPAERERNPAASVATVWQSALAAFILHAPAILLVACVCIAGPAMLCLLAQGADLRLNWYAHASGPLATWQGVTMLQGGSVNAGIVLLCLQAVLGAIGLAFARGVIARLALSDSEAEGTPSFSLAYGEAKARFTSLLVGSLIYGACGTVGAVGINTALRDTDFNLNLVGQRSVTMPGHTRVPALRALDAFVPNAGSPFAEFVPLLRHSRFVGTVRLSESNEYWRYISDQGQMPFVGASTPTGESDSTVLAISLASFGVLLLAEVLLRFTPIMAMTEHERTGLGAIMPVLHSIHFGIRHFGTITKHVWLLRLAFVAGYSVFFLLPVVLSEEVAPPFVTSVARSVMGSWSVPLTLMCHSLFTALFVAFSTVYDTRLAMRLDASIAVTSLLAIRGCEFGDVLAHAFYDGCTSINPRR